MAFIAKYSLFFIFNGVISDMIMGDFGHRGDFGQKTVKNITIASNLYACMYRHTYTQYSYLTLVNGSLLRFTLIVRKNTNTI